MVAQINLLRVRSHESLERSASRCRACADVSTPPLRGMLVYNALMALYLGYLGEFAHLGGLLLWPAVVLHAVVAVVLLWTRSERNA